MILLIDNYDSFVHNLARYFRRLGQPTKVVRNDAIDADAIHALRPAAVVLSPGPCAPRQAGCSIDVARDLSKTIPLLGVCLGHQAIAEAYGAVIGRAPEPFHGRTSRIEHEARGLFQGLPQPLTVGRYHSLIVRADTLPESLRPTAWTCDGVLMAFQHVSRPVFGVQFHPESILTQHGYPLLQNFLRLSGLQTTTPDPQLTELATRPRTLATPLPHVVTF